MEFIVIGLNHETAPLEIRERLAFQEGKIGDALCQSSSPLLKENMILSTCNRVEICAAALERTGPASICRIPLPVPRNSPEGF